MIFTDKLATRYDAGSATVLAGQTTVTPTGAVWLDHVWADDLFFLPGQPLVPPQRIEAVNADGTLTLSVPWPGADATAVVYEVRYVGMIERSTAMSRRVLEQLGDVKAWYDVIVEDDAARLALESSTSPLRAGYRVLVKDDGVIWAKETSAYGDWIGPVEFKGDKGNQGWSPRYAMIEDGERVVLQLAGWVGGEGAAPDGDVGKYLGASGFVTAIASATNFRGFGFRDRGAYSAGTAYAKGDVVSIYGSSWVARQSTTGNQPPVLPTTSNTNWNLFARAGLNGTGTGDMIGPSSSVDLRVAVFSGTSGKHVTDGGKTLAELAPGDNSISNAILADMATNTIKGRNTAGTGDPQDLTPAQVLTLLKAAGAYAKDNILGTVSQTAGVPTGAIIERGVNSNGEYVRWADGTQICMYSFPSTTVSTVAVGAAFHSGASGGVWTYPATFTAIHYANMNTNDYILSHVIEVTNTSLRTQYWTATAVTGYTAPISCYAIGRWF